MAKDLVVVGIGSSAGGLEALQTMLSNLPEIENCSYIIAQHLSPTHKSMMVELLSRTTDIPVIEVKNGMVIKAKTIYMTPENTDIHVNDSKMFLKNIEQSFGPKPSVNYFFNSLASSMNFKAIGLILSGTGSDGSYGIRAIKAEGGITIAQSPETAKYDGMPLSAINTGKVDLVIEPENIGYEIERIVTSLEQNINIDLNERLVQKLYKVLFNEFGVDFSLYKKSTISRRIERRMAALKVNSLSSYIENNQNNKEEMSNLYHDILIGVTSFFRDKESFAALKEHIKAIVDKKEQGEDIRFWSIGCSTGEEVYTLAILLYEILQDKIQKYKIKIFATDIDDESLKIARTGIYAETTLEGVDKDIIQKYFTVQKNQFEVKKKLRELVIFSRHNIISDSPFLRLDLITCRNMLIYFSQPLQNKFFPIVHYALNDNGILFLGKSESVGHHIDLFSLLDKNAKIFKVQYTGVKQPPKLFNYSTQIKKYEEPTIKQHKNEEELFEERIVNSLGEYVFDRSVILNSSNDLIYIKGKNPYIKHPEGKVTNNIFKLISEEISLDLRSAITEAKKRKSFQITPFRLVQIYDKKVKYIKLIVVPYLDERNDDWFNILFFHEEDTQNIKGHIDTDGSESDTVDKLTLELETTKTHLQNVIEELETSYEEMQSLNEELQSANEELQSSNEELETTNEELQSTNEELQTAYSELRALYEDKDKRAKQLEVLMEKLNKKTEDLRKQKEITEAILDTAPIAITLIDINGQFTFANRYAEMLYETDKKTILDRSYNSKEWRILNENREPIDNAQLPFAIIQKTFEPVYDIKLTIDINDKVKYLSVSGAPLFDLNGTFQGAVFCIDDETASRSLQEDITYYQSTLQKKSKVNQNSTYDLLEFSLLEMTSLFKNDLNQISLLAHTIDGNKKEITDKFDDKIECITKKLDERIIFHTQNSIYEKTNFLSELNHITAIFEPSFEQNNIQITNNISNKANMHFTANFTRFFIYNTFEFFLALVLENNFEDTLNVTFNNTKGEEDDNMLIIIFENEQLADINVDTLFNTLEENLKPYDINITMKKEKVISLEVSLGV